MTETALTALIPVALKIQAEDARRGCKVYVGPHISGGAHAYETQVGMLFEAAEDSDLFWIQDALDRMAAARTMSVAELTDNMISRGLIR